MPCCCSRWDYVSWSTKVIILEELGYRVVTSKKYARMVVDSSGLPYIWELLDDPATRVLSCILLGGLALDECIIPPILEMRGCEQLVALLK
jgi:hypothetical protein